jgi:hypothetical protein
MHRMFHRLMIQKNLIGDGGINTSLLEIVSRLLIQSVYLKDSCFELITSKEIKVCQSRRRYNKFLYIE